MHLRLRPLIRFFSRAPRATTTTRLGALGCWLALVGCKGDDATSTGDTTTQTSVAGDSSSSDGHPTTSSATAQASTSGPGDTSTDGDTTAPDASGTTSDASTSDASTSDASTSDASTSDANTTASCESDARAVKLKRLIDPLDGSVLAPAIVFVQGDRVVAVETDEAKIPCGAEIIDWSAYSGVPGLVDAHTHFIYQTDDEPGTLPWNRLSWLFKNNPALLSDLAREAAEKTVKLGVTTAIDKGAGAMGKLVVQLRDEIAMGEVVGPRIYTATYGIKGPVPSIETMKGWIHQNVLDGADLIKVWADGCSANTLECMSRFTFEELKAAVDEAHLLGKPIAIHAYHADTAKLAIMAGPDAMEHPEGLDEVDFMDMIAMGITYVPTIDHNRYYKDNIGYFGYDPGMAAKFDAHIALNLATANQAHLAGVKIAMGSDAVFSGFGENTRELEWFIEAGMTPLAALRAATIQGAASIGVDDEIGRVAVGYFADIVAVDGDPLTDIGVLRHEVHGVMKGGQLVLP